MSAATVAPFAPVAEAITAVNRGWSVIPVNAEKRPLFPWKAYQERCLSRKDIEQWDKQYHPPGYAVVTGRVSGVVVLDFDGDKGRETLRDGYLLDSGIGK